MHDIKVGLSVWNSVKRVDTRREQIQRRVCGLVIE